MIMKKQLLASCVMACLSVAAFAQMRTGNPLSLRKQPAARQSKIDVKKTLPALAQIKPFSKGAPTSLRKPVLRFDEKQTAGQTMHQVMRLPGGRELWGNMTSSSTWTDDNTPYGFYSFNSANPTTFTQMMSDPDGYIIGNAGSAIVDGTLYLINIDLSYVSYGADYVYVTYYSYDTNTWERTDRHSLSDITLAATETAQDATTGTVYGVFYNSSLTGFEFGTIDYKTLKRTTIGTARHTYVALGVASDGYLYGVASDGNLYKISTSTGAETLVGATGVTVADSNGFYEQSGEIDQKTNTFYWASIDVDKNCALYTVDLTTGAATKVSQFPSSEQILALTIPADAVAEGAPAAATALTATFSGPSTTGDVSFQVPTTTHSGATLTGSVGYTVKVNSTTVATGTAQPGETVTSSVTAPEGSATISVTLSNNAGTSAATRLTKYIGYDKPNAVTGITLSADAAGKTVTLGWTAPTAGQNGGYLGDITYTVTRYPEGTVVAQGLTATTYTETVTDDNLTLHYYGVKAVNGSQVSDEATSDNIILGDAFEPPYTEPFDDASAMNYFTILDSNSDGKTWSYYSYGPCAMYGYSTSRADDWLITSPVKLKADKVYTFSFKARCSYSDWPERLEVKYGTAPTAAAMTGTILEKTVLENEDFVTYKKEISVDTDSKVYFGFHAVSDANMFNLYVDDISIDAGSSYAAPDKVTDLTVTPDNGGALSATIAFTAPTKSINGDAITGIIKSIEVAGNSGSIVKAFTNVQPGTKLSAVDNKATQGFNTYKVTAYSSDGSGRTSEKTAYVGIDVPAVPQNRTVTDQLTGILLSWDKVGTVGSNGGVVKPDDVKYIVYSTEVDEWGHASAEPIDTVTATSYLVNRNTEEGEQDIVQYAVAAMNNTGRSLIYGTPQLVVGQSYTLPFIETLKGGDIANFWWVDYSGSAGYAIASDNSSDGDGCSFAFEPEAIGDSAWVNTGKISLAGATAPRLIFYHFCTPGKNIKINVKLQTPDGKETLLTTVDYRTLSGTAAWRRTMADIPASFCSERYVMVKFETVGRALGYPLYLDNIQLRNVLSDNIAISANIPGQASKGEALRVPYTVENIGDNSATAFTVNMKVNGETVASKVISSELKTFSTTAVDTLSYTVPVTLSDESVSVEMAVDYAADRDLSDNSVQKTVSLLQSEFPVPANVAMTSADAAVTFSWAEPASQTKRATETFDSYTPWTTNAFGDWTTVDVNKASRGSIFEDLTYPGEDTPYAYIIFSPETLSEDIYETNPNLRPHSGSQYAATAYSRDLDTYSEYEGDEWLISPLLSGEEQEITFWASNLTTDYKNYVETFEVMASQAGNAKADFTKVGDTYTASAGTWTQYSALLPAGTKYFAIHRNTEVENSYFLMIDDVTYGVGVGKPACYNIYCDGQLVANVPAGTYSYQLTTDGASHTYGISAVYATGESTAVNPQGGAGIAAVTARTAATANIYTLDGKLVERSTGSLKSVKRGIYIFGNKKVVVR